ncbi:MAG: PAS domain S-box protein [Chloroflexi bacterium]|nr:PAS domain S-box protein [Chloroflexota bacterium]
MSKRPRKGEFEAMPQTLEFFETLLCASSDGVVVTDATQNIIVVNQSFCNFFGQQRQDVAEISMSVWLDQLNADASRRWAELEQNVRLKGAYHDVEFQMTTHNGTRHLSVNASLLEQVDDEQVGLIISVWRDLTERVRGEAGPHKALSAREKTLAEALQTMHLLRKAHDQLEMRIEERMAELAQVNKKLRVEIVERKRAQEALRESEETVRVLLNAPTDTLLLMDAEGYILTLNETAAARFDGHADDLVGLCVFDLLSPDIAENRRIQNDKAIHSGEIVRFEDERKGRCFEQSVYPVFDAQGEPKYLAVFARDITERKRTEQALRSSEEYARNVIESSLDMIIASNMERRIVGFNRAAEETFGYRRDEVIGEHVDILYADPQKGLVIHETAISEGRCVQQVFDRRKNGEMFPVYLSASLLRDATGELVGVMGIARDITELKQTEEALRRHNQKLAMLNRSGQALASTLDLDQVLVTVLEEVRRFLNVVAVSVWLTDPATGELVCQQATGPQNEIVRGWRLSPGQGIGGWVVRNGKGLIVPDAWADERYFKGVEQKAMLSLRSILSIPLKIKDDVIGTLQAVDETANRFDAADLEVLESLVTTAAIAIDNARLYEQARQDAETKSMLLREVNHRVKNNLSAIVGLLYTERRHAKVEDQAVYQPIMQDLVTRVQGLSTVHSLLSTSGWAALLLSDLTTRIIHSSLQVLPGDKKVSVDVTPSLVYVTADQAHNLALLINELAINTVKHVLQERDAVRIVVRIAFDDGDDALQIVRFEFRDDGPGYPEDVLRLERHNVGFDLIQNIVRKSLRGKLSLFNDPGAVAVIRFRAEI